VKQIYLFDSDGTLYDAEDAKRQFDLFFRTFADHRLGIAPGDFQETRKRLIKKYGILDSSAHCFSREYGLPIAEIYAETYDRIDLASCGVRSDHRLRKHLLSLRATRHVWTNAPRVYVRRVVNALGLAGVFEQCFCLEDTEPYAKPQREAYDAIQRKLPGDAEITLIDDRCKNLETAHALGWRTVLAGSSTEQLPTYVHRRITHLTEMT